MPCKGANRPTACAKVQRLLQVGIALRAILEASKVGAWLRRALVWIGGQGEALPLPASGAREGQLGQHVVLSLPSMSEAHEGTSWLGDKGTRGDYRKEKGTGMLVGGHRPQHNPLSPCPHAHLPPDLPQSPCFQRGVWSK